jgi:hypothetical protein
VKLYINQLKVINEIPPNSLDQLPCCDRLSANETVACRAQKGGKSMAAFKRYGDVYYDIRGRALQVKDYINDSIASEIRPADIEVYQQWRLQQKAGRGKNMVCEHTVSTVTVNRELAIMRRIYNVALKNDLVEKNPVIQVDVLF